MKTFVIYYSVTLEQSIKVEANSLTEAINNFNPDMETIMCPDTNSIVCSTVDMANTFNHYVLDNYEVHWSGYIVNKKTQQPYLVEESPIESEIYHRITNQFYPLEVVQHEKFGSILKKL